MTGKISRKKPKKYTNPLKINIGSGEDYREGYVNLDVNKKVKADFYLDFIKEGLPFEDETADEVYCKNLFEHIPNPLNFLLEIKRVLKKGGKAIIITSNSSYLIYHFPRKKAYHDSYNLNHSLEDQHYFMFQQGHLTAFTKKAKLKLKKIEYYISNTTPSGDRNFQRVLGLFFGKKFGYSDFLWVVKK